jgi:transposase-like protein
MKTTERGFDSEELNLITLAAKYSDEDKARQLLESMRWPDGPTCPHCAKQGSDCKDVYKLNARASSKRPGRAGLYKCAACRKQFTVRVGTIFEDSHLPISKWLMAIFIMCSSKKGISAHQIHRMLDITYKSAWFMCHRIRWAMNEGPLAALLKGTVEVDETFVGGKGDARTKHLRKTPVVALVERSGKVRTKVISNVTHRNLKYCLNACVDKSAKINTDQWAAYPIAVKGYAGHEAVNHSVYEYRRINPDGSVVTTNSAESFFSLLKRGVYGSFHHVSREHLARYAHEFEFRWNTRGMTDGERLEVAIEQTEGKRLTYRQCV